MSESKVPLPDPAWAGSKTFTADQMRTYGDARAQEARRLALLEAADIAANSLAVGKPPLFILDERLRALADEAQPNRGAMAEEKQAQNP